jgi:hypothetical protein
MQIMQLAIVQPCALLEPSESTLLSHQFARAAALPTHTPLIPIESACKTVELVISEILSQVNATTVLLTALLAILEIR